MSAYVFDTDILTLFRRGHAEIERRVVAAPPGSVVTTVITVEEVLAGWYNVIRTNVPPARLEQAYARLGAVVLFFTDLTLLNYTQAAIARYERLRQLKLNVKKMDLRIAAIALEARATVVTRNARDFGRVPGLVIEDWSVP